MAKSEAQAALEKARKELAKAQAQHRHAFRVELAKLFNQYQLAVEADGDISAHLKIVTIDSEYAISELPE